MSDDEHFETRVLVRRRNPWVLGFAALPFGMAAVLALLTAFTGGPWIGAAPHLTLLGLVTTMWFFRQNPMARESTEVIAVRDGALHVGAESIPLGRVASAMIVPGPGFPRVSVDLRGPSLGPIELVAHGTRQGRDILRALGFDASQRSFATTAASWLRSTWPRWMLSIFGVLAALLFVMGGLATVGVPPFLTLAVIVLPFVALAALPTKVQVGGDGVYVSWLHTKKFVPIASIKSATTLVERQRNNQRVTVRLELVDSDVVDIAMGSSWDLSRAQALVERIEEVRADARRGVEAASTGDVSAVALENVRARLARTAATTAEWVRALRAFGSEVIATHRTAPVAPETFLRVVEDPAAKPTERAAAAIALASRNDPAMHARVRVASETVAQPKLRIALERALEDDEAALEAAVEELAREER